MPNRATARDQLAIDETVVEDDALASALEERAKKAIAKSIVVDEYDRADAAAKALLEAKVGEVGDAPIRIGRWRIERVVSSPREVSFETAPKPRIRIAEVKAEEPKLRAL